MKRILILLCLPLLFTTCKKEEEEPNNNGNNGLTYVPDDDFEAYLENNGMGNGIPSDDYVTTANINTVTYLDVNNKQISDLTGINDFTSLTYLDCDNNQLTTLDVSQNTALRDLRCGSNQLTTLDVSQDTALTALRCYNNQLISLKLQNGYNTNLTWVATFGNPYLTCIQVDNPVWSTANWWQIDQLHYFSYQCP
jgi:Leucine-rich repeat (LRR) protein